MRTNIEAERGRLMMSKQNMCDALGVTPKTYQSYISGGNIPSSILVRLRDLTGKSIDYLLGLDNQSK